MSGPLRFLSDDEDEDDAPTPAVDAAAWEAALVRLLAGVEQEWAGLAGCRLGPDADRILARLAGMLKATDAAARGTPFPYRLHAALADAAAAAQELMAAVDTGRHRPRGVRGVLATLARSADPVAAAGHP